MKKTPFIIAWIIFITICIMLFACGKIEQEEDLPPVNGITSIAIDNEDNIWLSATQTINEAYPAKISKPSFEFIKLSFKFKSIIRSYFTYYKLIFI